VGEWPTRRRGGTHHVHDVDSSRPDRRRTAPLLPAPRRRAAGGREARAREPVGADVLAENADLVEEFQVSSIEAPAGARRVLRPPGAGALSWARPGRPARPAPLPARSGARPRRWPPEPDRRPAG